MAVFHLTTVIVAVLNLIWIKKCEALAVMSIDIGSEWMKVAIVSPGVPMEIALNKESQRKTPVTVAFRDGERIFGDPALTIGVRFPEKGYSYLTDVLGKEDSNPIIDLYRKRFPYYTIEKDPKRSTIIFKHPDGESFTPEELMAMILKKAQETAENAAGQPIKDAVITVPPFFNQAERQSILLSAQMAGINVLQLMNSNTAVALNYGIFRRKDFNETPSNIMFFDMGAGNTVATVVSYQLIKSKETGEVNPQLTIKGIGFDRTLGGLEMQLRLRDHFAQMFNKEKKTKLDVFENPRAMAKLLKEAGRVKKVLSANTDHTAQVESLLDDKDFKCPVTREEFENLCADLFDRVVRPVEVALQAANLDMSVIDQVILSGSGARVPKVQQILLNFIQKPELGKSINTDESAALGAAYQAAFLSKGFKVKTFLVRDANVYPLQVEFQRSYTAEDGTPSVKTVRRLIFPRNNLVPQKKVMTFNRMDKDFDFYVNYADLKFLNEFEIRALDSLNLTKAHVSQVDTALNKYNEEGTEYKGVKVHFRIDESGVFHLDNADSLFEKVTDEDEEKESDLESTLTKLGNTIGRLFSSSDSTDDKSKAESPEEPKKEAVKEAEANASETLSSNATEKDGAKLNETVKLSETNTTVKKEPKIVVIKEPLTVESSFLDLQRPNEEEVQASIKKLQALDDSEHNKLVREKVKNSLESFIIDTKDKLSYEEYERASTEQELEELLKALNSARDWLEYESDDSTPVDNFKSKLVELKKLSKDLFERVKEHRERPEAIKALNDMLNLSNTFLNGAKNMTDDMQIFTEVEMNTLEKLIVETESWIKENAATQAAQPFYLAPKLTTKHIAEKIAGLDREVKYLLNKARFAPPKKPKETKKEDTNKSETETLEANETAIPLDIPESDVKIDETEKSESTESPSADPVEEKSHSEL